MAREPKPWFRADREVWCVTINGQRHNLGRDKKDAMRRFYEIMGRPTRRAIVTSDTLPLTVDAFLEWTSRNRSAATYKWYCDHLQSFVARYPKLAIEQLRPHHVETWASDGYKNVNTRRNKMRAVKRCLRWAVAQGYLDYNPITAIEIPAAQPRETYVTPDGFQRLLGFVRDDWAVELLRVTYETGCRPQESLRLEARHLDLGRCRWVFPRSEAKGKCMPRAVYLTDYATEVSRRLAERWPQGKLFRNAHGEPWNTFSMSCLFDRIQVRMGREEIERRKVKLSDREVAAFAKTLAPTLTAGGVVRAKSPAELRAEARRKLTHRLAKQLAPRCSLYVLRHSWATNALQSGVDALTVAILMGHKDPSTLARTYQHLSHDPGHLLAQARRIGG